MAEIRLICPGCAAEYRVPGSAIPPEGREVECSACGKVWHAKVPLALADFQAPPAPEETPAELPRLNRRLPDSVLDILRDEVEHERRLRAAEEGRPAPVDAAPADPVPAPAPRPAPDPEWPATTITRHFDPRPVEAPRAGPPEPAPAPVPEPPVPVQPAGSVPAAEEPTPMPVAPVPARRRGGYGAGFGLALMLAGGLVTLYLLAPMLADQGTLGEGLMDLRADLDGARLWLQDRAASLIR